MRLGTPIDYLSSRRGRFSKDEPRNAGPPHLYPLGVHPRLSALLVITLGLLTFFIPLVTVDPPVLDKTHWSAFDMVRQMYQGNLHAPACERCGERVVRALVALPFLVSSIYALMIAALLPLSVPYAMNTLAAISGIGVAGSLSLWRNATAWAFEDTFYGRSSRVRHVHYGSLQFALFGVMVALFIIAISRDGAPNTRKNPQTSR
jgi:hypothetical protein